MQAQTPSSDQPTPPPFTRLVDLASARLGGLPIYANDEFFAEKENLVRQEAPIFIADKYTDKGKWMDGWESRRRRVPGHDWCIVRLGLRGVVHGVNIDTSFFLGNHPPFATIEGLNSKTRLVATDSFDSLAWREILAKSPLKPGSHNYFALHASQPVNYLRLNIFPDGGVARLRVHGKVVPDWSTVKPGDVIDLAAVENGGVVEACNDMFFGPKDNLIMPGRGHNMSDGWETKRKRVPGHDWVVVRLGAAGLLQRIVVDTNNFKGNFPDRCTIEACHAPKAAEGAVPQDAQWREILSETKLMGHFMHNFAAELKDVGPVTHLRLNIFPDGGVARLRVFGTLAEAPR